MVLPAYGLARLLSEKSRYFTVFNPWKKSNPNVSRPQLRIVRLRVVGGKKYPVFITMADMSMFSRRTAVIELATLVSSPLTATGIFDPGRAISCGTNIID